VPKPSYELAHCIVCGHADATLVTDAEDMRREIESLWAHHERRLRPGTPTARLMDRVAFSEHPPLRLVRCRECGLVYRNPAERAHEVAEIYEDTAPSRDTLASLHESARDSARQQARLLRAALGKRGTGLEVGSYAGAFLAAARDEGLQIEGLDVSTDANAFVRERGFVVHDGDLIAFAESTRRTYDAIAIWNAFDQMIDPRGALHAAWKLLADGGVIALRVPNGAAYARWRSSLDRGVLRRAAAREVLAQNNLLGFPYRWGFTPTSLEHLLIDVGFRVTAVRGDVLVPTADEWTRGWARAEERLLKRALAPLARLKPAWAPWFEIYATRPSEALRAAG
jgi:SAM-dependent methyltransferase